MSNAPRRLSCRLQCILLFTLVQYDGLEYNGYVYPPWAEFVGWMLALASLIMLPLWAFIKFWQLVGSCHVSTGSSSAPVM